jgi:hypothetical protein
VCCLGSSSDCCSASSGQSSRYSLRDQHRLSPAVVGFGVEEFAPPLVANLFLQRLADMTVFLCADRGTVCEDEPVADTILLPRGAKQLVILDLHADEASKHGVAFNDIFWKRHLSALKPIGLASMLASRMPLYVWLSGCLVVRFGWRLSSSWIALSGQGGVVNVGGSSPTAKPSVNAKEAPQFAPRKAKETHA